MNSFGTVLRIYRETYVGLSQSKLADRAGFDHSYISRLESGHRIPTRSAVEKLCEVMALGSEARQRLMESAGFKIAGAQDLPPSDADIARVLTLLGGALRDDLTPSQYKHTLIRSVKLMLDGITYKDIA